MENPKIKTKVVHSQSKTAWNIIGERLGGKYKIARIPYLVVDDSEILTTKNKYEALLLVRSFSMNANDSAMRSAGLRGAHYQTTQSLQARQDA